MIIIIPPITYYHTSFYSFCTPTLPLIHTSMYSLTHTFTLPLIHLFDNNNHNHDDDNVDQCHAYHSRFSLHDVKSHPWLCWDAETLFTFMQPASAKGAHSNHPHTSNATHSARVLPGPTPPQPFVRRVKRSDDKVPTNELTITHRPTNQRTISH